MSEKAELVGEICSQPLESQLKPVSNFSSLSVTTLSESSVNLQWNYIRPENLSGISEELVFKLLRLEARDEWKSIAWTRKMFCVVNNLEQNVCYSLKLLVLVQKENEFVIVDETDVFKAS
jgi:hypothetical protein